MSEDEIRCLICFDHIDRITNPAALEQLLLRIEARKLIIDDKKTDG